MNKGGAVEGNDWLNGWRRMPPVPDFLRMFPVVKSKRLGKLGPGFGIGAGCGIGIGIGFMGGFGPGLPGLQLVIGPGAGCGVGLGFGYGYGMGRGKGIAYEGNLQGRLPSEDDIVTLIDRFAMNTKMLVEDAYKMVDKRKRYR